MRRAIGLTLAGLGAFLLVIAVLLRTYVPGQVLKYPLNEYLVTQLVGHGTDYFSPAKVKLDHGGDAGGHQHGQR